MAFMTALPYVLSAIPGLLSGAASIYQMAKGKGGRLRKRRVQRKRGRGPIAQALGSIPLLGGILGPLAGAFGGKMKRRRLTYKKTRKARGLQIDYYHPHFGHGMLALRKKKKRVHRKRKGYGMLGPIGYHNSILAKKLLGGLLIPAGGKTFRVKGYYKYTPSGKRVHVKSHISGRGAMKCITHPKYGRVCPSPGPPRHPLLLKGGYMPYRF